MYHIILLLSQFSQEKAEASSLNNLAGQDI